MSATDIDRVGAEPPPDLALAAAPEQASRRGASLRVRALVFVVGAASLGTEIAVARLLAPYFGASTIVWANTIAIVLLALSGGYWLGGRLADRHPGERSLGLLVVAAGAALAALPYVARPLLNTAVDALNSLSAGAFLGSLLAVLVLASGPVGLMGAVAPWAVRLSVASVEESGSVSGRLYAISTIGSLAGTFLAALLLIPFAGTHRTFLIFALALALAGTWAAGPRLAFVPAVIALLLALPPGSIKPNSPDGTVIYETETAYQYARVVQAPDGSRRLELNEGVAVHSLYRPGSFLTNNYWDDFLVLPLGVSGRVPARIAILGNAAGTTARAYGHYFPATAIDAVELDGGLTEIGRRYFGLSGPHLHTIIADARPFLRATHARYDAIFLDAYRQPYVPFYLVTREFFALVRQHLNPGGALIINVGHVRGSDDLEHAVTATLRSEFPAVVRDPAQPTNTLMIASSEPARAAPLLAAAPALPADLAPIARDAAARLAPGLPGGPVYTDDRAPVEWLIDRSIVQYAAGQR